MDAFLSREIKISRIDGLPYVMKTRGMAQESGGRRELRRSSGDKAAGRRRLPKVG